MHPRRELFENALNHSALNMIMSWLGKYSEKDLLSIKIIFFTLAQALYPLKDGKGCMKVRLAFLVTNECRLISQGNLFHEATADSEQLLRIMIYSTCTPS